MRAHGRVFMVLGFMQWFWYASDKRRETFVKICRDPDVQRLTWESYMNKKLVRRDPMAHVRVFFKDLAHLFGHGARVSAARQPDPGRGGGGDRRWPRWARAATEIGPWYYGLHKPSWQPPDWLFGAGLDADLRPDRAGRRAGLEPAARTRATRQRMLVLFAVNAAAERAVERAVLPRAAAGLGADRGGAVLAVDPGADRGAVAGLARRGLGCWLPYLAWVAFAAC